MHSDPQAWHIVRRWQSFEGELRCAVLRVVLVAVFYAVHLADFALLPDADEQQVLFHRQITAIAVGWLLVSLTVLVMLRQRLFPPQLKYATVGADLILVGLSAALGSGPASPLVGCFYIVIAMSTLRFSLPLIWFTTLGAMGAYWALVGLADETWFDADHVTAPIEQMVTLCSLGATGVVLGQLVRMIRSAATEYYQRREHLDALGSAGGGDE